MMMKMASDPSSFAFLRKVRPSIFAEKALERAARVLLIVDQQDPFRSHGRISDRKNLWSSSATAGPREVCGRRSGGSAKVAYSSGLRVPDAHWLHVQLPGNAHLR